jgi:hypothetical protein
MSPFFSAFIAIYEDPYDPDDNVYIAQNPNTLMTSSWYSTIEDLFDLVGTEEDDPYQETPNYLEDYYAVHSYYLNGKPITLEQAKADYPELFI